MRPSEEEIAKRKEDFRIRRLRLERAKAFMAFDIYKQNVSYGIKEESESTHNTVVEWYSKCLDLDENAISNVPDCIKEYMVI